jgi:hypothetical protein
MLNLKGKTLVWHTSCCTHNETQTYVLWISSHIIFTLWMDRPSRTPISEQGWIWQLSGTCPFIPCLMLFEGWKIGDISPPPPFKMSFFWWHISYQKKESQKSKIKIKIKIVNPIVVGGFEMWASDGFHQLVSLDVSWVQILTSKNNKTLTSVFPKCKYDYFGYSLV